MMILIILILALTLFSMWGSKGDKMTDHELYGMDSEDYLKEQVGEDYYNKHFK
jgi:hypothetical protein